MIQTLIEFSAPAKAAPASPPARTWMMPVIGDNMEPSLRGGRDFVVVQAVDRFSWDEVYAVDVDGYEVLYRCSSDLRGGIELKPENSKYLPHRLSRDEFNSIVIGRVIGDLHVRDRNALPHPWPYLNS